MPNNSSFDDGDCFSNKGGLDEKLSINTFVIWFLASLVSITAFTCYLD